MGKLNGIHTLWYKNGLKKRETNYEDDKKHGKEIIWNVNAEINETKIYEFGKLLKPKKP